MTDPETEPEQQEEIPPDPDAPLNPANPAEVEYHNVNYIPAEEEEESPPPPESDSTQADQTEEPESDPNQEKPLF